MSIYHVQIFWHIKELKTIAVISVNKLKICFKKKTGKNTMANKSFGVQLNLL